MTRVTVTTQAELDAALTNPKITYAEHEIVIDTPAGVWIEVSDDHGQDVRACGSSSVTVYGSASVTAFDSASVTAFGSASVTACGSSSVTAFGMALGVPGWELMRRAAEAGRLESVDEIAAGLINDEGWDE